VRTDRQHDEANSHFSQFSVYPVCPHIVW